jgi:hypothetical protein
MTRFSQLGPEFDNFLFAPIREDSNGMLLSVLSVLARLDIDPWQEAAKLSGLPGGAATQRLASLIAALPDESSADPDPATVAARLVALLPRPANPNIPSRATLFGGTSMDGRAGHANAGDADRGLRAADGYRVFHHDRSQLQTLEQQPGWSPRKSSTCVPPSDPTSAPILSLQSDAGAAVRLVTRQAPTPDYS